MQLKFSILLASLLVVLPTDALPVSNLSPRMVTLPLKRIQRRSDLPPQILLQQLVNRGDRRLARMTKRDGPTTAEMTDRIERRALALADDERLQRRYNRFGVPETAKTSVTLLDAHTRGRKKAIAAACGSANTSSSANSSSGAAVGSSTPTTGSSGSGTDAGLGAVETTGVTFGNSPTANDSLALDIEASDVGYLATVQMGTPPQNFLLLMDSGSADLWVGSENCQSQSGGGCGNHQFLGTQSSSTFQANSTQFSVTYGTGNVAGNLVQDNIVVAGLSLPAHPFGVATSESVDFSADTTPFDGLMGLAQSTLSEEGVLTPIEALAAANLVPAPITSFKISRLADDLNDGEVTFGGLDPTKFDSQTLVSLNNVNTQGFWEANLDAVTVNGADTGLQGRTAILDTGTTLIIAPPADAAAVHQAIPGSASDGQGGFTVPCTGNASVALTFGGTSFAIDPRDIAVQPVDANDPTGNCVSGIASGNVGGATEWLVGDVFLKNAYFSTNVQANTVSLAKLV